PPATARRVVQASNAAPLCAPIASPYQIFLWRGVLRGRRITGFTAKKGCPAGFGAMFGAIGSRSSFTLGAGAGGREATRIGSFAALSETTAGESLTTFTVSSVCGIAQIRSSVARTIGHLSIAWG